MKTNCEICGVDTACEFCQCESCRDVENAAILEEGEEQPDEIGRWLCKECIKIGGE